MGIKSNAATAIALTAVLMLSCKVIYAGTFLDPIHLSKNRRCAALIVWKNRTVSKVIRDSLKLSGVDSSISKYKRLLFFTAKDDSVYQMKWTVNIDLIRNGEYIITSGSFDLVKRNFLVIYDSTGRVYRKYNASVLTPHRTHLFADTTISPIHINPCSPFLQYSIDEYRMLIIFPVAKVISDVWKSKMAVDTVALDINTGKLLYDW
jgi:hypothetical protein